MYPFIAYLTLLYPQEMSGGALWVLEHWVTLLMVAVVADVLIGWRVYRKYRRAHPWEKVVLRK